jgi:hypothetical protein
MKGSDVCLRFSPFKLRFESENLRNRSGKVPELFFFRKCAALSSLVIKWRVSLVEIEFDKGSRNRFALQSAVKWHDLVFFYWNIISSCLASHLVLSCQNSFLVFSFSFFLLLLLLLLFLLLILLLFLCFLLIFVSSPFFFSCLF